MKKICVALASLMMFSAVARGSVYAICDVWQAQMYWIDTDRACAYGNQLILWATITDYNGTHITDSAVVIFDMVWRNINLIWYANSCTLSPAWNLDYAHAMIALIGHSYDASDSTYFEDSIFLGRITLDKQISRLTSHTDNRPPPRGGDFAEGDAIRATEMFGMTDPAASAFRLRSGLGHYYYLYDLYQVGRDTYCYTMIVEGNFGTTDGLMFFSPTSNGYDVIMIIFENDYLYGYSMVGAFDPWVSSQFAVITLDTGMMTTLFAN